MDWETNHLISQLLFNRVTVRMKAGKPRRRRKKILAAHNNIDDDDNDEHLALDAYWEDANEKEGNADC